MASLLFQAGPNTGQRYRLQQGEYIIGRRSDCQIFVPDMRVSRQHARIRQVAERWTIEDLGSNNGTFINGSRVESDELRDRDLIRIAGNKILVELDATDPSTQNPDALVTIVDLANPRIYKTSEVTAVKGKSRRRTFPDLLAQIELQERKLTALAAIVEAAARTSEPTELFEPLCQQLLDVFPAAISVGFLGAKDRSNDIVVHTQKHRNRTRTLEVPVSIVDHVIGQGEGVLLSISGSEPPAASPGGAPRESKRTPTGSRMGAPIQAHGRQFGAIYIEAEDSEFSQADLDLLTSLAAQIALAMANAEMRIELRTRQRLEHDLSVARQIQRSLLPPSPPDVVGLDFAVHYEPAYQIGGDFYDFIWHDNSHLAIVVGDVAGKAISAALYMSRLSSELRSRAALARTPARLLRKVNQEMLALGDDGMFATLIYAIYDLETRTLVFTNAGHVVPLLRRDQRVYPLHAERAHVPALGVIPQTEIGEARVQLHSGDLLVFTTDGIQEARNAQRVEYGLKRLSRRVRTARGRAQDVVDAIVKDVDVHAGPTTLQTDDITVAVMAVGAQRARRRTDTIPGIEPDDETFDGPTDAGE